MTKKLVVDCSTGVTTEVELTAEEVAQRDADTAAYAAEQDQRKIEEASKALALDSARTKLSLLGLTVEEINALGFSWLLVGLQAHNQ
jgi:hypothetical protein